MRRFFSDQSYWNIPIPAHVPIDLESQVKVELLAQMRPEGFWINHTSFTIPVFEATPKTPCHQNAQTASFWLPWSTPSVTTLFGGGIDFYHRVCHSFSMTSLL